ncbi:PKD domain-containing protein [Halostagnicola bangensis]
MAIVGGTVSGTVAGTVPDDCDRPARADDFEDGLNNWDVGGDVSRTTEGVETDTAVRITDAETEEDSVGRIKWECAGEFSTHDEFELRGVYQAVSDTPYNYRFGIEGDDRFLLKIDPSSDAIGFGDTTWTSVSGETIDSAFIGSWVEFRLAFDGTGIASAKVWERGTSEPDDWQLSTEADDVSGYLRASAGQNDHGRELLVDTVELHVPGETECVGDPTFDDFEDGLGNWETGGDVSTVDDGVVTETAARLTDSEAGEGSVGRLEWKCAGEFNTHDEFEVRGVYQAVSDAPYNYRFGISGEDQLWFLIDPSSDAISFTSSRLASPAEETIDDAFIGTWVEFRIQFDGTGSVRAKAWRYDSQEPGDWQIATDVAEFTGSIRIGAGQNDHGREMLVDEIAITAVQSDDADGDDEESGEDEHDGEEKDGEEGEHDEGEEDEHGEGNEDEREGEDEHDDGTGDPDDDGGEDQDERDGEGDDESDESDESESAAPTASFEYTPSSPETGEQVAFDASDSSAPASDLIDFSWEFGDGNSASGVTASRAFDSAGGYNVTLTVTDDTGAEDTVTEQLTLEEGDSDSIPGFGLTGSLATLGGVGYVIKRRLSTGESESE